ncbi:MAG TPA: zinc-ribbon domain-containing protein [Myxococcota bacterium]|nr:zinc-ribbon domain-containing protein [Myxococcota bacterium]
MKVTCPSCSASYRLVDDKVPDSGAQIKCPKCGTIFVVRRNKQETKAASPAVKSSAPATPAAPPAGPVPTPVVERHAQATPLSDIVSQTPNLDALSGEGFVSVTGPSEMRALTEQEHGSAAVTSAVGEHAATRSPGVSAIRAQSGARPKASLLESFRCRTVRGLTYDFPTRAAMIRWLSERDDLDGCEAAEPGGDWIPAAGLMELQATASRGTAEMIAFTPGTPIVEAKPPSYPSPQEKIYRTSGPGGDKIAAILWSLAVIILLATLFVAAGTTTRYGVLDLSPYLPIESVGFVFPGDEKSDATSSVPSLGVAPNPEKTYSRALTAGRRANLARKFSRAAIEFNRALSVHPGSAQALQGLAKAYTGLGDRDRAMAVMKRARSLGNDFEGK